MVVKSNMDWSEINKFIETSGGRAMIIIDGRPALVVMDYNDYRQLDNQSVDQIQPMEEPEPLIPIPDEISAEINQPKPVTRELAIDDLPLWLNRWRFIPNLLWFRWKEGIIVFKIKIKF